MQHTILQEIDMLKVEVSEGRRKILEEIERTSVIREDAVRYMKADF